MMEETTNIVLEHLRAMRAGLARLDDKMDTLPAEMLAGRRPQLRTRLDRIERRLDLVD